MAVDLTLAKAHMNITGSGDDTIITHYIAAADAQVTSQLGTGVDDIPEAIFDQAVLMLAAHWYENREAVVVGLSAAFLPMGVAEIIREYRAYSFADVEPTDGG
ncbi:uncharacterized phage protein (possible DNA packaging)/phage conserved hypothetical protein, phiE125 gp8 family [Devosia enhydra]|uniref:Phage gp6-like head-tail connector protein n=1 Tax=Devosia enhydra TaxID=665118 RepID=A0A1K2HVJ5_9HYPH|nr:head-tail connector protein [Devosia enhydra]SFZ82420.1 uncharacterized phage protein (possible DNA packaging)/phage conserved hypothetical protein, phiE125 gp8 family [Devosia enhydra]